MKKPKILIALLRMALGWWFLYQGVSAMTQPNWTIEPFIKDAQTFPSFYAFIGAPPNLEYISYITKGLFLIIGVLLVLGIGSRIASFLGFLFMALFYFPHLNFPYVDSTYYIVDQHFIFGLILLYLFLARSGEYFGLGTMFKASRY